MKSHFINPKLLTLLGAWRTGFGKHGPWDFGFHFFPPCFVISGLQGRNEKVALGSTQVFRINVCRSSVDKPNAAPYARMGKSESFG